MGNVAWCKITVLEGRFFKYRLKKLGSLKGALFYDINKPYLFFANQL